MRPLRIGDTSWEKLILAMAVLAVPLLTGPHAAKVDKRQQTVVGYIGDSMCGLRHGKAVERDSLQRQCTLQCVQEGSKFVLSDPAARRVYQLDDQVAPRPFAGTRVTVTGRIDGDTIHVEKIE